MRTAGGFESQLEERDRCIAIVCQSVDDVAQVLGKSFNAGRPLGEIRVDVGIRLQTFTDAEQNRVNDLIARGEVVRGRTPGYRRLGVDRPMRQTARALLSEHPYSGVGEQRASLSITGHVIMLSQLLLL